MSFIQQTESYYSHKRDAAGFKRSEKIEDHEWIFDAEDLSFLMSHYPHEEPTAVGILAQMGGIEGLTYALRSDMTAGLGADEVILTGDEEDNEETDALRIRRNTFGDNKELEVPIKPFWRLCLNELGDTMLQVLIVAGVISIIIGAATHPDENGWIDGLAILLAVCIVVFVGGGNNYQKELQFKSLEAESKKKDCIVLRNGEEKKLRFEQVVVGDCVVLRSGFTIPADGVFVLGTDNLKASEAAVTGESKELSKNRLHPFLVKGTNIVSGEGLMIAVGVGQYTEWGRLMAKLKEDPKETPLQEKLDTLANQIGYGGMGVAIVLFIVLFVIYAISGPDWSEAATPIIDYAIIAITIVVVAVPEGLPLAVTISLAYSMKKMLMDKNFVRHLSACETMGNATTICSDKTGTLTTNKMSVSKCHLYGSDAFMKSLPMKDDFSQSAYQRLAIAICTNTKSFEDDQKNLKEEERAMIKQGKMSVPLTGGNQTDCAILQWVIDLGASNYKQVRSENPVTKFFPFDSKVKRSSVLVRDTMEDKSKFVMYVKGAAEQILAVCNFRMNKNGEIEELTENDKQSIADSMDAMTKTGLRCLGVSYRIYSEDEIPFKSTVSYTLDDDKADILFTDMVWVCVVGIKDPVRPEVPDAVRTCQNAGIVVRMVTGDHLETAKHIAKECGILTCSDHVCMTGSEFRELTDEEKDDVLPRLRVLARSKPSDKEALVVWYRTKNKPRDIVAVTGDGANDALALKNADVGLAMGIQGTDVAKEASDVVIMDDNFASIEKTVMWGRSVYDNIRKFVQFQLTVNVTALTISLIGAFYPPWQNPLTAVQLLWVNLIMDTMAALALATEPPTRALLNRHPFKKDSHLITQILWRFIFGHSIYQLAALMITLTVARDWLEVGENYPDNDPIEGDPPRYFIHLTVVFNTFVWMQIFNEVNARKVNNERNIFKGITTNWIFWFIIGISVVAQILLVEFGGDFAKTRPLNGLQWGYSIAWGAGILLWHQVVITVPVNFNDGIQEVDPKLFKQEKEFTQHIKIVTESADGGTTTGQ